MIASLIQYLIDQDIPSVFYFHLQSQRWILLLPQPLPGWSELLTDLPLTEPVEVFFESYEQSLRHLDEELALRARQLHAHIPEMPQWSQSFGVKYRLEISSQDLQQQLGVAPVLYQRQMLGPQKSSYLAILAQIQRDIRLGEYYQCNYTERFLWEWSGTDWMVQLVLQFLSKGTTGVLGPMAHLILDARQQFLLLSNSPECLLEQRDHFFYSYPMKGTWPRSVALKERWADQKNSAELMMITDLVRNDFNAFGEPNAEVVKVKTFIALQHLWQQISILRKPCGDHSYEEARRALLPAGSITGAPKYASSKRLLELEQTQRGAYCSTTTIGSGQRWQTSLNIRTMHVNLASALAALGFGGGITLRSDPQQEWQELWLKYESFNQLWNIRKHG